MTRSTIRQGKILVTARSVANTPAAIEAMRSAGHEVIIATSPMPFDLGWIAEQMRGIDALVFAMEPVSAEALEKADRLRIIARPGVGYDTVDLEAATRKGVIVTIAAGTNNQSVADFTLGLLLQATRGIAIAAESVQQKGWERVTGTEVWGKKLAIIGMGRIGKGVAQRARGFDMDVLAVSPRRDDDFARMHGVRYVSFDEAIEQADFVSLNAPLTQETVGLIDARVLARMKRGAYVINTSRGGLVDEAALAEAVLSGHIAGAAVDVLQTQGAGSPSALIGVPGIIVTPHMATFTKEATQRVAMSVAHSIITALHGGAPEHIVNPAAWA